MTRGVIRGSTTSRRRDSVVAVTPSPESSPRPETLHAVSPRYTPRGVTRDTLHAVAVSLSRTIDSSDQAASAASGVFSVDPSDSDRVTNQYK